MGARADFAFVTAVWLLMPGANPVGAEERSFDLGLRLNAVGGTGRPSNDILGAGLFGHLRLDEHWQVGLAVDHSPQFDVERPYEFFGLVGDPAAGEVDAKGTTTALTVWIERVYARPGHSLEGFWAAGGGVAVVDVDAVRGPLAGGGTYDIQQRVDNELLLTLSGGLRWRFAADWAAEVVLRFDQHFTSWTATDRLSGDSASIDDYLIRGIHIGLAYRF